MISPHFCFSFVSPRALSSPCTAPSTANACSSTANACAFSPTSRNVSPFYFCCCAVRARMSRLMPRRFRRSRVSLKRAHVRPALRSRRPPCAAARRSRCKCRRASRGGRADGKRYNRRSRFQPACASQRNQNRRQWQVRSPPLASCSTICHVTSRSGTSCPAASSLTRI